MFRIANKVAKQRKATSRARVSATKAFNLTHAHTVTQKASFHLTQTNLGFFDTISDMLHGPNKPKKKEKKTSPRTETRFSGPTTGWTGQMAHVPFEVNAKKLPEGVHMPSHLCVTRHVAWNDLFPFIRGNCATLEELFHWMQRYQYRIDEGGVIYGVAPFPENFVPATKIVTALECATNEYALQDCFGSPLYRYATEREISLVFTLDAVEAGTANISERIHFVMESTRENIEAAIAGKDVINLLDGKPFNYRAWIKTQLTLAQEYGNKGFWPGENGEPRSLPGFELKPKR